MMILAKPKKPEKRITVRRSTDYPFDWTCKKVAFGSFLNWAKGNTPAGAKDVTLELKEEWDYYGNDCTTSLELSWDEVVDNPDYERELKKYETKLKRWKEQCQK
jgi:hypothetical protein